MAKIHKSTTASYLLIFLKICVMDVKTLNE